jgi:hypothetical protein
MAIIEFSRTAETAGNMVGNTAKKGHKSVEAKAGLAAKTAKAVKTEKVDE